MTRDKLVSTGDLAVGCLFKERLWRTGRNGNPLLRFRLWLVLEKENCMLRIDTKDIPAVRLTLLGDHGRIISGSWFKSTKIEVVGRY